MGPSFNQRFDQHGTWRRMFAHQLAQLGQWMGANDLLDAGCRSALSAWSSRCAATRSPVASWRVLARQVRAHQCHLFAGYGRRIMPASAGRTTMCPTELGYDGAIEPCLRLLPIETRLQASGWPSGASGPAAGSGWR